MIGGRSSPWLEAMALHLGAREVAVMEVLRGRRDSGLTSEHAKVDRCNFLHFISKKEYSGNGRSRC